MIDVVPPSIHALPGPAPPVADDPRPGEGLRIAMFTNNYRPRVSGVAVAVEYLERALREAGHETLVVAPDYEASVPTARDRVLRVRSLPLRRWNAALPLPRRDALLAAVARFRPDVLHTHHPFLLGKSAVECARALDLPLVATFHTFYEAFLEPLHLGWTPLARRIRERVLGYLRGCDLVVAPTELVRAWLQEQLGPAVATAAAPTGIDVSRFEPLGDEERAALRARLGVAPSTALLVWAGRVTPEKNPALAVETLATLRARNRDVALLVLGDGPASRAIEDRAHALGLDSRLLRPGFVERARLPAWLAAGDLLLFTSWTDTQAIVAYEAWAAGLRVVSVRSLAGRALVEPGANGLLAEDAPEAFADATEALLADPDRCRAPFPAERFGRAALGSLWSLIYPQAIERARLRSAAAPTQAASMRSPVAARWNEPKKAAVNSGGARL